MKTLLLILFALPAFAQGQQNVNYIATTGNVSLSSSTTAATLQQPATNQTNVTFPGAGPQSYSMPPVGATVYCSAACVATISRSCTTAASATAGTVTSVLPTKIPQVPPASVTFWTASNASSCTTLRVINVGAGQEYPIDLSSFSLATSGLTSNITISIASVTATVNITFYPVEQH